MSGHEIDAVRTRWQLGTPFIRCEYTSCSPNHFFIGRDAVERRVNQPGQSGRVLLELHRLHKMLSFGGQRICIDFRGRHILMAQPA